MFVKSTHFKQVCQLLLSLIVATLGVQNRYKLVRRPKSKQKFKLVLSKVKSTIAAL